jgi:murein DD-endopeptidase MepM/ murein hydrolase activator NlpD
MRIHPIYKTLKMHTGVDFVCAIGTPVYATGDGIVMYVEKGVQGYGEMVVINHGYGYKTLYAHLSRKAVRPGQKVKRGEIIGYTGNSGLSTGPHLHYEVRKNNIPVNPVNFFSTTLLLQNTTNYRNSIKINQSMS